MTRLVLFLVHNWPLKLAAVVLSTLLYGVIVLTQDTREIPVSVQIERRNQPEKVVVVSNLGEVRDIRFLAPDDVPVNSSSFRAFVDVSTATGRLGDVVLPVTVEAIDERVRVITWEPRQVRVRLDELATRSDVDVRVVRDGQVPDRFEVREPVVEPATVTIEGASADVARVSHVEAHYQFEATPLDINREVPLQPVDAQGELVPQVDVEPAFARLRVVVIENRATRLVPVRVRRQGEPAPGFTIRALVTEPDLVLVEGDGEVLEGLTAVETEPVEVAGITSGFQRTASLVLPPDVLALDGDTVTVRATVEPVDETRAFNAGVDLVGERADLQYAVGVRSVVALVSGFAVDLDRLEGATFTVTANVAGLGPGRHGVPLTVNLPVGLRSLSISPPEVVVTISAQAASPAAPAAPP